MTAESEVTLILVAAGVPPGGNDVDCHSTIEDSTSLIRFNVDSGPQDAALYGSRDDRRHTFQSGSY